MASLKPAKKTVPGKIALRVSNTEQYDGTRSLAMPDLLRTTTRGGGDEMDPLLAGVKVVKRYDLASATRGEVGTTEELDTGTPELLAVEAEDGSTLFIRSDALAESVARIRPEAVDTEGRVDLSRFRDPNAADRGLGDVFWKVASVLKLPDDGLVTEAEKIAKVWARKKLGDLFEDKAYDVGSFLGAKALMWKIESALAGRPGLYHWHDTMLAESDRCDPGDARLTPMAEGKPALVLVHGTGSYSVGGFGDLRSDAATWSRLQAAFPGGIFGYEHRTFSESPVENALALLKNLPEGARVSLVSHSRGGLVADLLCLGQVKPEVIDGFKFDTAKCKDPDGLAREADDERRRLRDIVGMLNDGHLQVERYVRVACPARGTRFLSDNLDAALSDFLNLLQWGGGALIGATAAALGGPVAGERFGKGASSCLGVVKRLVLEIAGRRIDPLLVPGIAAMRIDSPLARFLAHPDTRRRDGIRMAVIAGDTEFDSFGLSNFRRRVANLFCDWRLFDRNDNDLVVDTDSMYAGLGFREGARYLYDQDESVTHFRYFKNPSSRDGLRDWLAEAETDALSQFLPLTSGAKLPWKDRDALQKQRGIAAGPRPVVILMPGIMGSHIEINRRKGGGPGSGNRIWFEVGSLFIGRLADIRDWKDKKVEVEDLFEMFYGDLADHLALSHEVIRCPYDWRKPLKDCAQTLKDRIEEAARAQPGQPIRLLAHSMGGLVARAMIKEYPDAWRKVVDTGGRLIMLGTPNNGSHLMVHTLLGKSGSMRKLEMLDAAHGLQDILDIVAGFPGALALLPRGKGFVDTGFEPGVIAAADYYEPDTWTDLRKRITDRWYGDGVCGVPEGALLGQARDYWDALPATLPDPAQVAYVYGQSDKTPCGVRIEPDGRVRLLFTHYGDGSVTWQSGRLDGLEDRSWYMPVEHGDLAGEEDYFPAIVELLENGTTDKLGRLPSLRGDAAASFTLDAEPPVVADAEELARAVMGSGPRRRKAAKGRRTLRVSVHAGNLFYVDQPVLCGHYVGDAISGAEGALDRMLGGLLSERDRLGIYAGPVGSSAIVLLPPNREQSGRRSLPGAVIVGLGEFNGQLSTRQISETVRAGTLRFLLQMRDSLGFTTDDAITLYSVLIGWASTSSISVAESVAAITRGVLEANRQFQEASGKCHPCDIAVTDLTFVELYRDAAISAARAVLGLRDLLASDLKRLGARIDPATSLHVGDGVLDRLCASNELDHWSRLIITDADATDANCPAECYEVRTQSAMPPELLRRLCRQASCIDQVAAGSDKKVASEETAADNDSDDEETKECRYLPERLKYVFLSNRARAETVWQRRQPGLVEEIVRQQRQFPAYNPQLGKTLFHLMVPLDYQAAAREQSKLMLVLDGYTANLPWELLKADDDPLGEPLVVCTQMVRQLVTSRYRGMVRSANTNSACIIVNPSTKGFDRRFPSNRTELDKLTGAEREGKAVAASLRGAGWQNIVVTSPGQDAIDVINVLYDRPYRVLSIGAHGIFEAKARDGNVYSGVVLSNGMLITSVELGQMEVVPEVVFLSCCHLGSISNPYSRPNRLAYSLARELIEMGVRCVVAAGWAVNDDAACTFASTFFDGFAKGQTFGDAIYAARRATYAKHRSSNTWGAYQAYGDPGYRLKPQGEGQGHHDGDPYVAVDELLAALDQHRQRIKAPKGVGKPASFADTSQWVRRQVARCPSEWAERPDVLQALGCLYGEFKQDGFDAARDAYRRAIQKEDKAGRVAVRSIEQLANLEARRGGGLVDDGKLDEGKKLIESAVQRIDALVRSVGGDQATERNAERAAILGSAHKLWAGALSLQAEPAWKAIRDSLAVSANAYLSAITGDPAQQPYNTLNYLPLAWLAGELQQSRQEAIDLALRCGEQARKRFADSKDIWDAVMSVDAEMTAWLLGNPMAAASVADELRRRYDEAVKSRPLSEREWDSVVKQWRVLARFLKLRKVDDDVAKAKELSALADHYSPQPAVSMPDKQKASPAARKAGQRKGVAPKSGKGRRK